MVQAVDLQLGFAVVSGKASLAVKRRLACEHVEVWDEVGVPMLMLYAGAICRCVIGH